MKFYNREIELQVLSDIRKRSTQKSEMTVLVGRRRIGKTRLILKSLENEKFLYFFIAKKNEKLLCDEFLQSILQTINIPVFGKIQHFKDLFALLIEYSKQTSLNLVIDEFQEFSTINSAIYSEMQYIWDRNKEQSKLNLILSGSIYSLMTKIFENSKEPLFGRASERIFLKPFDVDTLKLILKENYPEYSNKDLLAFYIFTGGVAKYVEYFVDKNMLSYEGMLNEIFRSNSYFIEEGKNLLIEEFGKEYTTYFSILSLIASSKTSRTEIESILEKDIGGYLEKLEYQYNIIRKVRPVLAKPQSRVVKYLITDNFLSFWFKFIYKNKSAVEIGNFEYLKSIVNRDFDSFSGTFLEKYFIEKLSLSKQFSTIGNYWEKKNKNEIDIVAFNELSKKLVFYEIKLNKDKISLPKLKEKSKNILSKFNGYSVDYHALSLADM